MSKMDIVKRLRGVEMIPGANENLCHEAATEIERLNKECADWVMMNAKLHGEISDLLKALRLQPKVRL